VLNGLVSADVLGAVSRSSKMPPTVVPLRWNFPTLTALDPRPKPILANDLFLISVPSNAEHLLILPTGQSLATLNLDLLSVQLSVRDPSPIRVMVAMDNSIQSLPALLIM
jgi:hypothetical protein